MSGRDPERFEDFDARLRAARSAHEPAPEQAPSDRPGFGSGIQAGIDVVAGVGVGLLVGWALDSWLGTTPILLVVFLFLGSAAGLRNAYRSMARLLDDGDRR